MNPIVELVVGVMDAVAAVRRTEKPGRRPPVSRRTLGLLWVVVLAAVPLFLWLVGLAPSMAVTLGVSWVVLLSVALLITGSSIEVAVANRRRSRKRRQA